MKVLKLLIAVLATSLSLHLIAQNEPAPPGACGDLQVSMAVKLDKSQPPMARPVPGKALVYFIQDMGAPFTLGYSTTTVGYPTTKIGVDGEWVGANKQNSWFSVDVAPGEHHLCAAVQSSFVPRDIEIAHLTAEAGMVYYYRTRIVMQGKDELEYLTFQAIDSDEGQYLVTSHPLATTHAHK